MNRPTVTIITCTYNSIKFIDDCVKSVINQDYKYIEYLFIDGKSNDGTLEYLRNVSKTHDHIRIISEKDNGVYFAFNRGIKESKGKIIGFLHSDDFFSSDSIVSEIVNKFLQYQCDGVYGDLQYVDPIDKSIILRKWKSNNFKSTLLKFGWMPPHPTLFLSKKIYDKFGLFDTDFKISSDYDYILRIFSDQNNKFIYHPKLITSMRVGGISNRNLKNIMIKMYEDYDSINKNKIGGFYTLFFKNIFKVKQFF